MDIHLVDGTYELFRAYYGAPEASAPDGREVGATRALGRSLLGLVQYEEATHIAVAFDHTVESFRNEMFDGYKTGEGLEPDILNQFELAEQMTHALGMIVWPMVKFEADDALAAGAARYGADERVDRVLVCTPDKDLAQSVVGTRIVCVDRRRKKIMDEDGVREKFGVSPKSIPDWLALVGDAADGIPGIPRWGARSAAIALARYEHIESIPRLARDWDVKIRGAATLADNLNAERDAAELYRRLATLRVDVPLEETLEDLEWRGARRDELEQLCESLGDTQLVERVSAWR